MFVLIKGVGLLLVALAVFSLFSLKAPKGDLAMSGLANAAIASYLIEAIHRYIIGDIAKIQFFEDLGTTSGSMGGVAAAIMVPICMGANPVYAVVAGVAVGSYGILPGFVAGYAVGFLAPLIEKKLPEGINSIFGSLAIAPIARLIAMVMTPVVNTTLLKISVAITAASDQSPIIMGLLLGGIMKIICTSPLSSMAITAMLGLKGSAMGIAAVACFGGAFANGIIFRKMNYGKFSDAVSVIMEPLTQAKIITSHPLPIYTSSFIGGALAGLSASIFGIVNDAPGTASTIPGLLAPFAFNSPEKVIMAMALAVVGGIIGGYAAAFIYKPRNETTVNTNINVPA